jgi:Phage tail protein
MSRNLASLLIRPIGITTGDPNERILGTGITLDKNGNPVGTGRSGPTGIESVIEYNGIYLNVREWIDTYLVTSIGGLDDADVRDSREVNPGYHGETAFPSFYGGRTIALTGKVVTKTIWKLRDMQQGLRQAFAPLDTERPLIFHTPSTQLDLQVYCRKNQPIQMLDEQKTANHFERNFLITLRASNPRFVSVIREYSVKTATAATFDAIAFSPVNNGNYNSQPEIQLLGPMTNPKLINESVTPYQTISIPTTIPAGERWIIDTANRRMYRQSDTANRFQYLDPTSDWMELAPGKNNLHFVASGMTSGTSQVVVYHRHTVI